MRDFKKLAQLGAICAALYSCGSPSAPDERGEERTIRYVPQAVDDYCPQGCADREVGPCEISRNIDVLFLGKVVASDYVLLPCDQRVYRSGHFAQRVEVLEHLVGDDLNGDLVEIVVLTSNGIAEDVGDEAVFGLRNIDDTWFRLAAAPVEVDPTFGAPATTNDDYATIYRLPTKVTELKSALEDTWRDFDASCMTVREEKSDSEIRASIFDAPECPDNPSPSPTP